MIDSNKVDVLMTSKGITNRQMAEDVGISEAMMTYIRQGKRRPGLEIAVLIAEKLGVTVDDLLRKEARENGRT